MRCGGVAVGVASRVASRRTVPDDAGAKIGYCRTRGASGGHLDHDTGALVSDCRPHGGPALRPGIEGAAAIVAPSPPSRGSSRDPALRHQSRRPERLAGDPGSGLPGSFPVVAARTDQARPGTVHLRGLRLAEWLV